jgi:hypothetical protein
MRIAAVSSMMFLLETDSVDVSQARTSSCDVARYATLNITFAVNRTVAA